MQTVATTEDAGNLVGPLPSTGSDVGPEVIGGVVGGIVVVVIIIVVVAVLLSKKKRRMVSFVRVRVRVRLCSCSCSLFWPLTLHHVFCLHPCSDLTYFYANNFVQSEYDPSRNRTVSTHSSRPTTAIEKAASDPGTDV